MEITSIKYNNQREKLSCPQKRKNVTSFHEGRIMKKIETLNLLCLWASMKRVDLEREV